jgi:hypothetical protein
MVKITERVAGLHFLIPLGCFNSQSMTVEPLIARGMCKGIS